MEGSKEGLLEDLDTKLADTKALAIINGPLMTGMDEVGRLFARNELIVAEVLQSAEVMKAAVTHLEPHMEQGDTAAKGKLLLATVKGDVHDIGKNLVDIILSNNGFDVVNLGIKVPPAALVAAVREHQPDAIGLSGLLVKSAQQMVATAEDLHDAGISVPILVGGAALSRNYTVKRIRPAYGDELVLYSEDAMTGLALMERVVREGERESLFAEAARTDARRVVKEADATSPAVSTERSSTVPLDVPVPLPPDLQEHVVEVPELDEIFSWINPIMLYGRHMGLKGAARKLGTDDPQARKVEAAIEDVKALARDGAINVRGIWRFFRAASVGNRLALLGEDGGEVAAFNLPRQPKPDGLCLADYVIPARDGVHDHVAAFVTTAGEGVSARAEELKEAGE